MTTRRSLVRLWRRFRRPSFARLVVASLTLHVAAIVLAAWMVSVPSSPPPKPPDPLVVELPPAEAGHPLVRPEAPQPGRRAAPPAVASRPSPPRLSRAPATPASPAAQPTRPAAPAPAASPPPAAPPPAAAPSVPPAVARAPEPPAQAPEPPARPPVPEPAPPAPPEPSATPAPEPAPAPPAAVARAMPPVAQPPAVPGPAIPAPSPSASAAPADGSSGSGREPTVAPGPAAPAPSESPFAGRRFSLLRPQLDVPALPAPLPGGGGRAREGEGSGEGGRARDGGPAIPLNKPPDPDHADYFLKVKKAIEDHWSYPTEAARRGQSGQLVLEFVIRRDGNVLVELSRSSGVDILDRYAVNAVKLSAPFPPVPERLGEAIRISASFTYVLDHGFRVFGLR